MTAPVEAEAVIWFAVPVMEVTPELVIEGDTVPTTVKEEQETPDEQEAEEVATLRRAPEPAP